MRSHTSSRTSSTSSFSSDTRDLSATARAILTSLSTDREFTEATAYVSPLVTFQQQDEPPVVSRDALFKGWSQALERMPNLQIEIKEACADEAQRKVWVRSEITGLPNGIRKESIDMMTFDEEGLLHNTSGYQRIIRRRDDDDE